MGQTATVAKKDRRNPEWENVYQEMLNDIRVQRRFRVNPSDAGPKKVFLNCHYCGFAAETVPISGACPKCGGSSWERFALSAKLVPEHMLSPLPDTRKRTA